MGLASSRIAGGEIAGDLHPSISADFYWRFNESAVKLECTATFALYCSIDNGFLYDLMRYRLRYIMRCGMRDAGPGCGEEDVGRS
jgi:hypothetical protein